jgi:hypothetical protein
MRRKKANPIIYAGLALILAGLASLSLRAYLSGESLRLKITCEITECSK